MNATTPFVTVGYDGSPCADAALDWAADVAAGSSATSRDTYRLHVVIISASLDPADQAHRAAGDHAAERWRAAAEHRLETHGVTDASVEVRNDPVVPGLLDAARGASLLVVGSLGHGLGVGTLMGSVSQHVARYARCPVVVVRSRRATISDRVVVGVDGSPESRRALRFACEWARRNDESVTAIHGYFSPRAHVLTFDGAESEFADRQLDAAHHFVEDLCREFVSEFPDVEIEPEAIPNRPAEVLVNASKAASLVVVGSRGRDAFTELLLGSVSQHVLHHAQCPVAVVR